MNTFGTVKKLTASSAMAGVLGLAALGLGSGLAAAAPTHSAPSTNGPSRTSSRFEPKAHQPFPTAPRSPHLGQGHKGWNEPVARVIGLRDTFTSGKDSTMATSGPSTTGDKSGPVKHELFPVQHGDV